MSPNVDFWRGKRVLVTGHTGFKGSWMALWLHRRGAAVVGLSLPPTTTPNLFELARVDELTSSRYCDIRDGSATAALVRDADPEIVIHMAAQPLVRASYRVPLETFATNVQGTASVLDALREVHRVRVVVAITTDKVYRNLERPRPHRESDALGGHDPYSASKAAAEIVIASYADAFLSAKGVAVASARAGNVIGGGDWSEDRLIPDAVRAWSANRTLRVRAPHAVRPWQHVLEPLAGYLQLAERLWEQPTLAGPYNFGPETEEEATVRDVVELAKTAYGSGSVSWNDNSEGPPEATWLALEIGKARTHLGVEPRWALQKAVERTMRWYRQQLAGADARELCEADLDAFEATPVPPRRE